MNLCAGLSGRERDQATNILKKIAKRNDRQVEEEVYRSFEVNISCTPGENWSLTTTFHEMQTYRTKLTDFRYLFCLEDGTRAIQEGL